MTAHITGEDRTELVTKAARYYQDGHSIRATARHISRSYGGTRRLLEEADIALRTRQGQPRRTDD